MVYKDNVVEAQVTQVKTDLKKVIQFAAIQKELGSPEKEDVTSPLFDDYEIYMINGKKVLFKYGYPSSFDVKYVAQSTNRITGNLASFLHNPEHIEYNSQSHRLRVKITDDVCIEVVDAVSAQTQPTLHRTNCRALNREIIALTPEKKEQQHRTQKFLPPKTIARSSRKASAPKKTVQRKKHMNFYKNRSHYISTSRGVVKPEVHHYQCHAKGGYRSSSRVIYSCKRTKIFNRRSSRLSKNAVKQYTCNGAKCSCKSSGKDIFTCYVGGSRYYKKRNSSASRYDRQKL